MSFTSKSFVHVRQEENILGRFVKYIKKGKITQL